MEENKLMLFKKPEMKNTDEISGVIVQKSKRKLKRRKKKWLILIILLIAIVGAGYFFRYKIKEFVVNLLPFQGKIEEEQIEDEGSNTATENEATNNNAEGNITNFINTSPAKTEFINECGKEIFPDTFQYPLKTAHEVYSSFSTTSPVVLLVSFSPKEAYYKGEENIFYRETKNVQEIGTSICDTLNSLGVNASYLSITEHNGALYDSKTHYEQAIKEYLKSNPSICYVFDISRDIKINYDSAFEKEMVFVNDTEYPTIRLICGTNEGGITEAQKMGIYFADCLMKKVNDVYPLLISEQVVSKYSLSQCFNVPTVRVDIGSYPCTYDEAIRSANVFAVQLAELLLN